MNWNRAKRSTSDYPVLTSDRDYTSWCIKMNRQATLDRILRLIGPNFLNNSILPGSDTDLFTLQITSFAQVLDVVLQTMKGILLVRQNPHAPRIIWKLHETHHNNSDSSQKIAAQIGLELSQLNISTLSIRMEFMEKFDALL